MQDWNQKGFAAEGILEAFVDHPLVGVVVYANDHIVFANRAICDALQRPLDELRNLDKQAVFDLVHPEDRDLVRARFRMRHEGKEPEPVVRFRVLIPDDEPRWVESTTLPFEHDGSRALLNTYRDLTLEMRKEEERRETREMLAGIYRQIPTGLLIYRYSDEGRLSLMEGNPAALQLTGIDPSQWLGRDFDEIWPEARDQGITRSFQKVMETGETYVTEDMHYEDERLTGAFRVVAFRMREDQLGVAFENVTARKASELALSLSEEKFRFLFEHMAQGVVYQDADGAITSANPAAERILGLSLDQMQGRTSMDPRWRSVHEDLSDFPGETHPAMVALKSGRPLNDVVMGVFHPEEERHRWILVNAVPQFQEGDEHPGGVFSTFTDITPRKELEDELSAHEMELRKQRDTAQQYLDIAGVMFVALDQEGRVTLCNPKGCEVLGWRQGEILGRDWFETCIPEGNRREVRDVFDRLIRGEIEPVEYFENPVLTRQGEERMVWWHNSLRSSQGRVIGILSSGEDITERMKDAEAIVASREQLRRLNVRITKVLENERTNIARQVHDELGQILTALRMDATGLISGASEMDVESRLLRLKGMVGLLDSAISSVRGISRQLRPGILDDLGLCSALETETEEFWKRSDVVASFKAPQEDPELPDEVATALFRIYRELLTNVARHARAGRVDGKLVIEESGVTLSVKDDGVGIPDSVLNDPDSLGLLGMRERVDALGGQIRFQGSRGGGTRVEVRVPLGHDAHEAKEDS